MYPYTFELADCRFCGEKIDASHRRCPYCAGIQPKKKNVPQETIKQPEAEYQGDSSPGFGAQPEVNAGTGFILIDRDTEAQGERNIAPEPAADPFREIKQKSKKPIGNGKKVFLTVLVALVPVLGQLLGLAISAIYMSSSDDDRASFGSALFKASVTLSLMGFIAAFVIIISLLT